jgi:hypothetical protein
MIYGLFVVTLLLTFLIFLLLNSKIIIESSSFKIPKPPPISKKPIQKQHIIDIMKADEDDGLYNQIN